MLKKLSRESFLCFGESVPEFLRNFVKTVLVLEGASLAGK